MKATIALLSLLIALTAHAQLILDTEGGDNLSVGPGTAAYDFTVGDTPITLRLLGVYDWDATTPGLYSSHSVGIWDAATKALVASVVVPAQGATALGAFWYMPIAPLTLLAGHHYMIGARYSDNDFDFAKGNVLSVTTDLRISLEDAWLSSGVGFEFPDLNVSGANYGFFGANAGFEAVPEPQAIGMAAALALVVFIAVRRRWMTGLALLGCAVSLNAAEPAITVRSILDAAPAHQQRLLTALAKQRPAALATLAAAVEPPANRPPITPGNEHGQRPLVPPGIVRNYGTP